MAKSKKKPAAKKPKRKRPKKPPAAAPPPYTGPEEERPLDEDEQRYVDEYLVDRNKTNAFRRAFPGRSYRNAGPSARLMHERPHVRAELKEALRAQSVRTNVRADMVLHEMARLAFADVLDLYDPQTGLLRHVRGIPIDTRRAVQSIRVSRERRSVVTSGATRTAVAESVVEYKLHSKADALGKLATFMGLATPLPPLEVLLSTFPPSLAAEFRRAIAAHQNPPPPVLATPVAAPAPPPPPPETQP